MCASVSTELQVFKHAHFSKYASALYNQGQASLTNALRRRQTANALTVNDDLPACWRYQSCNSVENARLSSTIGSDECDDLARANVQAKLFDRSHWPESDLQ